MTGSPDTWAVVALGLAAAAGWLVPRPPALPRPRAGSIPVLVFGGAVVVTVGIVSPRWWAIACLCGGLVLVVRALLRRRRQRTQRARVGQQVLEACDLVAGELSAGSPAGHALARAAEVCPLLVPAHDAGRLGSDVASALRRAAQHPGADDLRLLAAAWQVAHHSGQGLATATTRVARRLRAQRRTARLVESELSSARATARLVSVLPVAAWVMGAGTGGRPLAFLTGGPVGLACLGAGLGLSAAGLWWIESLADEAAR